MARAASGDETWGTQGRVGKLAVGKRRLALPMRQGERSEKRLGGAHRQDCRGSAAVSMHVAAPAVRCPVRVSRIAMIGIGRQVDRRVIVMRGLGVIHLLMGKGVRLGELRRVQDR